jgi:multidrug efflux pump subunit AcrB
MRIIPPLDTLHKMEKRDQKIDNWLEGFYRKAIGKLTTSKTWGYGFLLGLILAFVFVIGMFFTTAVKVKMLPFDNKPEFSVVIDMPDGTALPETATVAEELTAKLLELPEVVNIQNYIGTARPFDFNGLVRHYYLRMFPWQAEIQVQLVDKAERDLTSHQLATKAREILTPIAKKANAVITVVEMPPGPPVLQTVVAEVHGPDEPTRIQVANDLTRMFHESELIGDVDNFMRDDLETWRFEVDLDKAASQGIPIENINQHLAMGMGEFKVGDIKQRLVYEPTYILIQIPLEQRSQISALGELPVMTEDGRMIPLSELGQFVKGKRDHMIFHKDLRPVEFVVGDAVGALPAPIYAMLDIEDMLEDYTAPDGVKIEPTWTDAPKTDTVSGMEWSGEWTVTYETFRDMGIAFGIAIVAIYMLVVWQFGNFSIPLVIMAPIPLTLLGIVPGHWLVGIITGFPADFTATSMIGWIALAGIIVRNSILLIDFTIVLVGKGVPLYDAVITATKARTRPIMITALALILGSAVILTDPTFQGMAISLLFGVFVSTILTLFVIPLGCLTLGERIFQCAGAGDPEACKDVEPNTRNATESEEETVAAETNNEKSDK